MKHVIPALAILCMAAGAVFFLFFDEDERENPPERGAPVVSSTLYPLHYFVRRIAGDLVAAELAVPPGSDPLHWRPDATAVQRLQQADLLVFNGAGAEPWAFALALPQARVIETAAVFRDDFLTISESTTHSHGPGGTHTHEGVDPHTWMDPVQARAQAEQVWRGLRRVLPDHHRTLDSNFRGLAADLDALHEQLSATGDLPPGEVLVASHPAYDYMAKRYGWNIVNFDFDPSRAPLNADELAAVRSVLEGKQARFILWEAEPSPALARQLNDELGLSSILFEPCEVPDEGGGDDYLAAMQANAARLAPAFR